MPHTTLPPHYPLGCTSGEIREAIENLQEEISGNSTTDTIVVNRSNLIQLGQTELSRRFAKWTALWSFGVGIFSLLFSFLAIYLTIQNSLDSNEWKQRQLEFLERIERSVIKTP